MYRYFLALAILFTGFLVGFFVSFHSQIFEHTASVGLEAGSSLLEKEAVGERFSLSDKSNVAEKKTPQLLTEPKGVQIDLATEQAFLFRGGKLANKLPLAYQSPDDKWFKAPTGYFRAGWKGRKHLSSIFPVYMPYAIQYHEDFFLHGIPYHKNGERVSNQFTGGCLRFQDKDAKTIFDFTKSGEQVLVYESFPGIPEVKESFHAPVDLNDFWVRQRFNNPLRRFYRHTGTSQRGRDYYQHAGIDLAPYSKKESAFVFSVYKGEVAKIVRIENEDDHGLGNTVIVRHNTGEEEVYSLYAHLSSIRGNLREGEAVSAGEMVGKVGNSGYGCQDYWQVGPDGCDKKGAPPDTHLHFEVKSKPVLHNPEQKQACETEDGSARLCYGYTPTYSQQYGYFDPLSLFLEQQ